MPTDHAIMILRRAPQNAREAEIRRDALRALTRAGYNRLEIEIEGMTTLDAADMATIAEAEREMTGV